MNRNIKYNPKCVVISKLIDLLYDLPDCSAGGCCHVVTDDDNIYDRDLQFVIDFCKEDRNKNAIDKEISTLICTMMLELSFIERVILCEMRNIYGNITEELWSHYVEHELTEETLEDYDFNNDSVKMPTYFYEPEDLELTDKETKAAAETFKEMFTNSTVAYKLDSRKKSIKYSCSECKGTFYMYDKYDYCPRCGAHIVGVEG